MVRNECANLKELLTLLRNKVDEIIVVDGMSTDGTYEIASVMADRVYQREPQDYCEPDRQYCVSQASNNMVLVLDADERPSRGLLDYMNMVDVMHHAGYWIVRRNHYTPTQYFQHIYYPDLQLRLFDKNVTYLSDKIHESAIVAGRVGTLPSWAYLEHHPKNGVPRYTKYIPIHAKALYESHPRSPWIYLALASANGLRSFLKDTKAMFFLDGVPGWCLALLRAYYNFMIYYTIWSDRQ